MNKNVDETFILCGKLFIIYLTKNVLVTYHNSTVDCFCVSNRAEAKV